MCSWGFNIWPPFDFLNVHSTTYLPYQSIPSIQPKPSVQDTLHNILLRESSLTYSYPWMGIISKLCHSWIVPMIFLHCFSCAHHSTPIPPLLPQKFLKQWGLEKTVQIPKAALEEGFPLNFCLIKRNDTKLITSPLFFHISFDKQCLCCLFVFWLVQNYLVMSFNMLPFYLTQILHARGQEECKILTFVWTFKCTHNTVLSTRPGKSYDWL
jgi:hypothetical protein